MITIESVVMLIMISNGFHLASLARGGMQQKGHGILTRDSFSIIYIQSDSPPQYSKIRCKNEYITNTSYISLMHSM